MMTVAVMTDFGEEWRGPLNEFLKENSFDPDEETAILTALEADEAYTFGGGASVVTWVERVA